MGSVTTYAQGEFLARNLFLRENYNICPMSNLGNSFEWVEVSNLGSVETCLMFV
jgi:hypothetical protein